MSQKNGNVKIGDNNKIKNSSIGNIENTSKKEIFLSKTASGIFKILGSVVAGIILNWLLHLLGLK